MLKIKKLSPKDVYKSFKLFDYLSGDLEHFTDLGWSLEQMSLQFSKKINFSLGLFNQNSLEGIIIGNLITIDKKTEYEILILYVNNKKRNLGYATALLANVLLKSKQRN